MTSPRLGVLLTCLLCWAPLAACGGDDTGDDDDGPGLDDFLPDVPAETGEAQSTYAGAITQPNSEELIAGPASAGLVGDFFIRNDRARFVIQAPGRVIGVVPQGGNVVDAVALDDSGNPVSEDHFGELSLVYLLGRTCDHQRIEVLRDGSGGGPAVLRAIGVSGNNDFINLRAIGLIPVPLGLDPDIADSVECATTYELDPGASHLRVSWTLFNGGLDGIRGPLGAISDTGGETDSFSPLRGFERLGISALTTLGDPAPVDYTLFQGPGVAYGLIPRHADPAKVNSAFLIAGVSVLLFKADALLDITVPEAFELHLEPEDGVTETLDLVVGADAGDVERRYLAGREVATAPISGTVAWSSGAAIPTGVRVGFYLDGNGDGDLDDEGDLVRSYADLDAAGGFHAELAPGAYLVRAEIRDTARSAIEAVELGASGTSDIALTLPQPIRFDYTISDGASGALVPAKVIVIGAHPAFPDARLFDIHDRVTNVVRMVMAGHGTSVDVGDGADPVLELPAGGDYRVFATHGTQWSFASTRVLPNSTGGELAFTLWQVAPATGYVASEYHVHQIGSPDSPVSSKQRVLSAAAAGVELFATTDHDYVSDLEPVIEDNGLARVVRAIPGIEVTPFAYGHFNAWPIVPDDSPNHGAVDWASGEPGYAKTPGEIFAALRERGAELVQINHPRKSGGFSFQEFFDRAGLFYDYANRVVGADFTTAPVPNQWLRLPDESLWDPSFNALEVWNGFGTTDSDLDGVREIETLDRVLRDWFNFLSFGMAITPCGNSDTHTLDADSMGMPRTYVRVSDATYQSLPDALEDGSVVDDALATLTGVSHRDVVVTNAPFLTVRPTGGLESAIGAVYDGTAGAISFDVTITAPEWAEFDTLEVFANATPESPPEDETSLQPLACWTSRALDGLPATEPCMTAPIAPAALTVERIVVDKLSNAARWQATITITIAAADIAAATRAGAVGTDAWLVFRTRGNRAIFPMLFNEVMNAETLPLMLDGDPALDEALRGVGVPAEAFTAPIYVDFDGGGYLAPFAP